MTCSVGAILLISEFIGSDLSKGIIVPITSTLPHSNRFLSLTLRLFGLLGTGTLSLIGFCPQGSVYRRKRGPGPGA